MARFEELRKPMRKIGSKKSKNNISSVGYHKNSIPKANESVFRREQNLPIHIQRKTPIWSHFTTTSNTMTIRLWHSVIYIIQVIIVQIHFVNDFLRFICGDSIKSVTFHRKQVCNINTLIKYQWRLVQSPTQLRCLHRLHLLIAS